jgi:putative ABC transport system permease protein
MGDYRFYMQLLGAFAGVAELPGSDRDLRSDVVFCERADTRDWNSSGAGAGRGDVLTLVAALGLKLAVVGVAAGLALAFGLTRFIATFLYGVKSTDPLTYAIVAIGLIGVAMLASYVPARRALRVDPIIALRYE